MTRADHLSANDEPVADVQASSALETLLQHGRWDDAATYYPTVDDPTPIEHAQLLLGAGRSDEAHAVLTPSSGRPGHGRSLGRFRQERRRNDAGQRSELS